MMRQPTAQVRLHRSFDGVPGGGDLWPVWDAIRCPTLLLPQHMTRPSFRAAQVWSVPHATLTTSEWQTALVASQK